MARYLIIAALVGMVGELDAEIHFKWKLKKGSTKDNQYIPESGRKSITGYVATGSLKSFTRDQEHYILTVSSTQRGRQFRCLFPVRWGPDLDHVRVNDTIKVIGDRRGSEITAKTSPKVVWKNPKRSSESPLPQVDLDYFESRSIMLAAHLELTEHARELVASDLLDGAMTADAAFDEYLRLGKEREEIVKELESIQRQVERLRR